MKYFNLYAEFWFLYFISTPSNHSLLRFWFYLRYKNKYVLFDFYFAKFTSYTLYLLLLTIHQFVFGFTLDIKIRKVIQSLVLSFSGVLKVANFLLPSLSQFFLLLLGRNLLPGFSTNYARFLCLFLWCIMYCMVLGNIVRVYP